jgi:nucleoside-diphosphate-sugar epimerase
MKELINKILAAADVSPVTKTIPTQLAYSIGIMMEFIYKIFKLKGEPIMTRFVAKQLSCAHWYDLTAAKTYIGYQAKIGIDEGMERLKASLNK